MEIKEEEISAAMNEQNQSNTTNFEPCTYNDITMSSSHPSTIISVEEFFHYTPNTPWKPLPEHDLKQSPCYPIIDIRNYHNYNISYYCKLHPDIEMFI